MTYPEVRASFTGTVYEVRRAMEKALQEMHGQTPTEQWVTLASTWGHPVGADVTSTAANPETGGVPLDGFPLTDMWIDRGES